MQMILKPIQPDAGFQAQAPASLEIIGEESQRLSFPQMLPKFAIAGIIGIPDIVVMKQFHG